MKYFFFFLFFVFFTKVFTQVKIDSIVSISFLEKPESYTKKTDDTIATGYILKNEKDSFFILRVSSLDENGNENSKTSSNALKVQKNYKYASIKLIEVMKQKKFTFSDSTKVKLLGFDAYRLTFLYNNSIGAEYLLLELNGIQYLIIYSMITEFNEKRKNNFIESLTIKNIQNQSQVKKIKNNLPKILDLGIKVILPLLLGLIVIIIILYQKKYNNR